jgi:hypothetical protein
MHRFVGQVQELPGGEAGRNIDWLARCQRMRHHKDAVAEHLRQEQQQQKAGEQSALKAGCRAREQTLA